MLSIEKSRALRPFSGFTWLGLHLHARKIPILVRYKVDKGRRGVACACCISEGSVDEIHVGVFSAGAGSVSSGSILSGSIFFARDVQPCMKSKRFSCARICEQIVPAVLLWIPNRIQRMLAQMSQVVS